MHRVKHLAIISLIVLFLAGVGHAEGSYGMPFDDAEVYIQALEDAMDARYGSRDAWPQGFDTFLAVAKYFSGVETSYESTLTWATAELQAMEANAVSDSADPQAVRVFLYALSYELREPGHRLNVSWPYEAQALYCAALTYSVEISWTVLPTDNDLPEEDAIAIAKEAIQKEYDLSDAEINQYAVYTFYSIGEWFGSPFWGIVIGLNEEGYELYYAYIASPTGEVLRATRNDALG